MRTKIICHMIGSVDGRLRLDRYTPLHGNAPENYVTELYLNTNNEQNADAWIIGKASVQEMSFPNLSKFINEEPAMAFDTYVSQRNSKKAVVVFDSKGSIDLTSNNIMGDEIIVVLGKTVSENYLEHLRTQNISYLFAGSDGQDIHLALKILNEDFGLYTFTLLGGGTINGSFLKAGLIDELLLQVYPGVDGLTGISSIFDYKGNSEELPAQNQALELLSVQQKEYGVVYLHYQFHKTNNINA